MTIQCIELLYQYCNYLFDYGHYGAIFSKLVPQLCNGNKITAGLQKPASKDTFPQPT